MLHNSGSYLSGGSSSFDEMYGQVAGDALGPRAPYADYSLWLDNQELPRLQRQSKRAQDIFRSIGITFNVYGGTEGVERLIPFDVIPRIISGTEWKVLEEGVRQRVGALNSFIYDIYHRQEIIKAGVIPASLINNNAAFTPQMMGFDPPGNIYTHVAGIDIIRTGPNNFSVLEDNLRVPSGVSYMLENRETMMHMFPELFEKNRVRSVEHYPHQLYRSLCECFDGYTDATPTVSLLSPGVYNSAYFEHAFLADQMGVELIEGADLVYHDGRVAQRTTQGPQNIDIIYKRIDDPFLDPLTFKADGLLGMPGLFDAYRAGKIMLANAPGAGIADDKAVYSFVPDIIKFYTGEAPELDNIETWRCSEKDQLAYVLDNLEDLVVKEVHGSGGYGMMVGPTASKAEVNRFRKKLKARPAAYIAQPTLALSTVPTLTRAGLAPRHVDLRPFVLVSPKGIRVTPGGLTRVALKKGSLIVNSSQGGGTKDTWIVDS
ncbi:MAG: circularly permuted type 2 ATP-grasp protein [PS1 clade bacterium]|nr:circularly permuted type 2 ATP-grasp protein [PS1 clade bacterium]